LCSNLYALTNLSILTTLLDTCAFPTFDDALCAAYDAMSNPKKAKKWGYDIPARLVGIVMSDQMCGKGWGLDLGAREKAESEMGRGVRDGGPAVHGRLEGEDARPSNTPGGEDEEKTEQQKIAKSRVVAKERPRSTPVTRTHLEELSRITKKEHAISASRFRRHPLMQKLKLQRYLSRPPAMRATQRVKLCEYTEEAFRGGICQFVNQGEPPRVGLREEYLDALKGWDCVLGRGEEGARGGEREREADGGRRDSGYASGAGTGTPDVATGVKGKERGKETDAMDLNGVDFEILKAAGGI
jgi:hypothetical protein